MYDLTKTLQETFRKSRELGVAVGKLLVVGEAGDRCVLHNFRKRFHLRQIEPEIPYTASVTVSISQMALLGASASS